ncbi:IclR family transcriptional regulator [Paractinoplanes deccanensis]|uniref:IclR family transcriptional regulator n=1 Tax=Paractinoplanes deccanensis TaxID=113561 RepID=A0ABQ3YLI7_9ACTN|nr:IclR family transcriptional regulator [Actinoplanes deccanensis]GID80866.1 IclR family transcriptional regulator [Actinoplanes deccanensis]
MGHPRPYGDGLGRGAGSVLGKARLILEAFEIDDAQVSLSELARRTGISKTTVHRLAQELLEWGMLERSDSDYRLGMRAFELGSRVPRFRVLRDAVRPYMHQLHTLTKETVHLAVLDGLEVLFLEKLAVGPRVAHQSRIAGRLPLHCTATGKALLAYSSPDVLDAVLARPLERLTPMTIVVPSLLREQIRKVREVGHARESEETAIGYCSTAVPLFGSSGVLLGAVSVTAPTFRADVARYVRALTAVRRELAAGDHLN